MLLGLYAALVILGVLIIAVDSGEVLAVIVPDRYRDHYLMILVSVFLFLVLTPISWIYYMIRVRYFEDTNGPHI